MTGHPSVVELLPAVLRRDWVLADWATAIDQLLDPVIGQIDRLDLLLDPDVAPPAMVDWLCLWVGWELPTGWPTIERRRHLVRESGRLLRTRGTGWSLRRLAEVLGGDDVEHVELDDTGWVVRADGDRPPPGGPPGVHLTICGRASRAWSAGDRERLVAVLHSDIPCGVTLTVTWA